MNYFAHGFRFLDRPYFVAGTAVPDWLAVADRSVRLRPRRVSPFACESASDESELASGILQHLDDDQRFHGSRAFVLVTATIATHFREVLGGDSRYRPSLLAHIATEMLLDGVLIEAFPGRLDKYYDVLATVDPDRIEASVNRMAKTTTTKLAPWIAVILKERFLYDYADTERLRLRLNQVMRRIKLEPLPESVAAVLDQGRTLIEHRWGELLPDLTDNCTRTEEGTNE